MSVQILIFLCACSGSVVPGGTSSPLPETPSQSAVVSRPPDSAPSSSGTAVTQDTQSASVAQTSTQTPQTSAETAPIPLATVAGELVITFDFVRQSGSASNQFAVWIEDMGGNLVRTLYATGYTANGGFRDRPDSIAIWVEKSGLSNMPKSEVDAITGATPRAGALSYTWDLTGADGTAVTPGEYMFFVEGTLRWKNFVLFSGIIDIGNTPATTIAGAEFTYESSGRYDALTANSPENNMIGTVTATFTPLN